MKLTIVRHGETIENVNNIHQGQLPGKMTITGIDQAKKLGLRLKDEKFDIIYCSDLKRTVDTAKEIIKYHPETKVNYVKELREGYSSTFQGLKEHEIDWENRPKDAESLEDVQARIKGFFDKIYPQHKDQSVLFVSHGGPILGLIASFMNKKSWQEILELGSQKNTAVNILEINDNDFKTELINCTKHLK